MGVDKKGVREDLQTVMYEGNRGKMKEEKKNKEKMLRITSICRAASWNVFPGPWGCHKKDF